MSAARIEKLEALLARVQRNRRAPRVETATPRLQSVPSEQGSGWEQDLGSERSVRVEGALEYAEPRSAHDSRWPSAEAPLGLAEPLTPAASPAITVRPSSSYPEVELAFEEHEPSAAQLTAPEAVALEAVALEAGAPESVALASSALEVVLDGEGDELPTIRPTDAAPFGEFELDALPSGEAASATSASFQPPPEPAAPAWLAPTLIEAAAPQATSAVARVVASSPATQPATFGELLARSLRLRPR